MAEDVALVVGVDRHVDGARACSAKPSVDETRSVYRHDRDLVALAGAERGKAVRRAVGAAISLGESLNLILKLKKRAVAVALGRQA